MNNHDHLTKQVNLIQTRFHKLQEALKEAWSMGLDITLFADEGKFTGLGGVNLDGSESLRVMGPEVKKRLSWDVLSHGTIPQTPKKRKK